MSFPAPPPDQKARRDKRVRGWIAFTLGILGGAYQMFFVRPIEPGFVSFSIALITYPAAEELWASRKSP